MAVSIRASMLRVISQMQRSAGIKLQFTQMRTLTRRTFITKSLGAFAGMAIARNWQALAQSDPHLSLKRADTAPIEIPANFTGLGYEMSSIAEAALCTYTRLARVADRPV